MPLTAEQRAMRAGKLTASRVRVLMQGDAAGIYQLYQELIDNNGKDHPGDSCIPSGIPEKDTIPDGLKIVQTPDLIVFLHDSRTIFRPRLASKSEALMPPELSLRFATSCTLSLPYPSFSAISMNTRTFFRLVISSVMSVRITSATSSIVMTCSWNDGHVSTTM